jgi:hypothetical protein
MILSILEHTPVWVWVTFCAVITLGILQIRTREVSAVRATVLPVVMIALSLSGVLSAFSQVPLALSAWLVGLGVSLKLAGRVMAVRGASWSAQTRHFRVPGSFVPLTMILGVFVTKYAAGAMLAINPSLAANMSVVIVLGLVYGAFAGLFWARARSLRALIHGSSGTAVPA